MKSRHQRIGVVLIFLAAAAGTDGARANLDDIIEATFRNAVVKVDVSSNTPVIRNNINVCNSQGTGFIISSSHVATAAHVFQVDPECGQPIILVKSRQHSVTLLAHPAGSKDDVAVLKVDQPFPASMCALGIMRNDVYDRTGYRFGIPGQFEDPAYLQVKIGQKNSQFAPLVRLTATPAEAGESGGPVIYNFHVVGILKAKHQHYVGYSFMMVGSQLRSLIASSGVPSDGKICNPVELDPSTDFASSLSLRPNSGLSASAQATVMEEIAKASEAKTAKRTDIWFSQVGDRVSISASDRQVVDKVCSQVGWWKQCKDTTVTVPGLKTATEIAAGIRADVTNQLWRKVSGETP